MSDYNAAKAAAMKKAKEDDENAKKEVRSKSSKEQAEMLAKMRAEVDKEKKPGGLASKEDPVMDKIKSSESNSKK